MAGLLVFSMPSFAAPALSSDGNEERGSPRFPLEAKTRLTISSALGYLSVSLVLSTKLGTSDGSGRENEQEASRSRHVCTRLEVEDSRCHSSVRRTLTS